jgi:hypothetical protein
MRPEAAERPTCIATAKPISTRGPVMISAGLIHAGRSAQPSLKGVLTQEPWRSGLSSRGLRITGAKVPDPLDLGSARISVEVWLDRSRFEDEVNLESARFDGLLTFDSSTFDKGINADSLEVSSHLFLRNGAEVRNAPLVLASAKIRGQLSLDGSTFDKGIKAENLEVSGHLSLRNGMVRNEPFVLLSANVEGDLQMTGSTLEEGITFQDSVIRGDLFLTNTTVKNATNNKERSQISFVQIEGWLDLSGAELPGLDLTGATIGELRLGSKQSAPPKWTANAEQQSYLILLDRLETSEPCPNEDAWPQQLNLQGLVYEQLGADPGTDIAEMRERKDMRERDACWYEKWLGRDSHFAHQPYRQLATVLRAMGDPDRAEDVLYAARDRERAKAWADGEYLNAAWLYLLKKLIGYGIGNGPFLVLYWVLMFTLIGMAVLAFSPWARKNCWAPDKSKKDQAKCLAWMFGASLDHLLPIVSLNKEFEDFFNDRKHQRLNGWQLGYFAVHALLGFLLGSFVVAALAGLTQSG